MFCHTVKTKEIISLYKIIHIFLSDRKALMFYFRCEIESDVQ